MRGYGKLISVGSGGEILAPTITINAPFNVTEGYVFTGREVFSGYGLESSNPVSYYPSNVYGSFGLRNDFIFSQAMGIITYPGLERVYTRVGSPDVTSDGSRFVTGTTFAIYYGNWNGSAFVETGQIQLATSDQLPAGGLRFGTNDRLFTTTTSGYILGIYTFNGTGYDLTATVPRPAGIGNTVSFQIDGDRIIIGTNRSPFYVVCVNNNGTWETIPSSQTPALPLISSGIAMKGDRAVVAHNQTGSGNTFATVLQWNGLQYVIGSRITAGPTGVNRQPTLSYDANNLLLSTGGNVGVYNWNGSIYSYVGLLEPQQNSSNYGVGINSNNEMVRYRYNSPNRTAVFDFYKPQTEYDYSVSVFNPETTVGNLYIAREDATTGQSLRTYEIPAIR